MDATYLIPPLRARVMHFLCGCLLCIAAFTTFYTSAAQAGNLVFNQPVTGIITSSSPAEWRFTAQNGEMLSFVLRPDDTAFDPVLTIFDSTGTALISNDDFAPPDRAAVLEGITIPRSGSYTASISGYAGSTGSYSLTMLPGYSELHHADDFATSTGWAADGDSLNGAVREGGLALSISGVAVLGTARGAQVPLSADYYAQVNVRGITGQGGWIVGMTARQQTADDAYVYQVSDQGLWRALRLINGTPTLLRDWGSHPAIIPGENAFRLGILANGTRLEFFYNGSYLGGENSIELRDGSSGVLVATLNTADGETRAQFDDLLITTPQSNPFAHNPQQLMSSGTGAVAQELERRRLIPTGGGLGFLIESGFAEYGSEGVTRFPLVRGASYTNFALGTTVSWDSVQQGMTGCGLVFRDTAERDYTLAFVDQTGGYGVSRRVGDIFEPGIFGEGLALSSGPYNLLVIAHDATVIYYVDGVYRGIMDNPSTAGEVGIAVVNYAAVYTACDFRNTWIWSWE